MRPLYTPRAPFCSVVNAASCPGDRRTMLVNVAASVRVFRAPLGAGGSGNLGRRRALEIAPYLLLKRCSAPPPGYFWPAAALWSGSSGPGKSGLAPIPEQAGPPPSRHGFP
jgi:hypothetical protein